MKPTAKAKRIRTAIESAVQSLDEKTGSKVTVLYPLWENLIGKSADAGAKFQHHGTLYCVNSGHTFSEAWVPGNGTESLYREIPEWFAGTQEDPIPYKGNMVLERGKYYTQNGVMYRCIRDTGIPVHEDLATLGTVQGGMFVEVLKDA